MSTATQHKGQALAVEAAPLTERAWTVDAAYAYCERLARAHYENFPVGSLLVPRPLRKHFYAIYAFARTADDFADEGFAQGRSPQERLEALAEWGEMLKNAFAGRASHPVFIALAETSARFDLPIALFEALLSAFSQDVTTSRYESFDQLLDYCRRSANPVGRLILLLFGHKDGQLNRWSDDICTGLQLANHWQDIAIDLDKDRIYLPAEDLVRFGLSEQDLLQKQAGDALRRLMAFEIDRAREFFRRGKPLCTAVGGRLGLELRAVWLGGWRILDRIEKNDYDVFTRRPVITAADKLRILGLALRKGAFQRFHG